MGSGSSYLLDMLLKHVMVPKCAGGFLKTYGIPLKLSIFFTSLERDGDQRSDFGTGQEIEWYGKNWTIHRV